MSNKILLNFLILYSIFSLSLILVESMFFRIFVVRYFILGLFIYILHYHFTFEFPERAKKITGSFNYISVWVGRKSDDIRSKVIYAFLSIAMGFTLYKVIAKGNMLIFTSILEKLLKFLYLENLASSFSLLFSLCLIFILGKTLFWGFDGEKAKKKH